MNFEKQLKSGLRKCKLHKFGATYILIKDGWLQCKKCKGFYKVNDTSHIENGSEAIVKNSIFGTLCVFKIFNKLI